jgi:anti-sigma factor RsiW
VTDLHPLPADLLDLHFGELAGPRQERAAGHVAVCPRCREELAAVSWVDRSLAGLPDEEPPVDGLERVLARVEAEGGVPGRPALGPDAGWVTPVAATLAGVGLGTGAIYAGGAWLSAAAGGVSGFAVAALAFFGIGSLVTLALAPVLLMDAQPRRRALAGR